MSTITPGTIDPTKPETGEATTASVRANESATQANFTAAKNDIEALETGKEDTGTAAAAVAEHEALPDPHSQYLTPTEADGAYAPLSHVSDANPHSGSASDADLTAHTSAGNPHSDSASLTDFTNHKSEGGAQHPVATTGAGGEGFLPALSGSATEYLNGTGGWSSVVAPGTGIAKGDPFVVGDLMAVESDAGDGSAQSTGIAATNVPTQAAAAATAGRLLQSAGADKTQSDSGIVAADVSGHIGITSGNPHGTDAADVGADPAGTAAAAVAAHEALPDPHSQYLQQVVEDATPVLGGDLQTKGNNIALTRSDDSEMGRLIPLTTQMAAALAYTLDGEYQPDDGGVLVAAGRSELGGAQTRVGALAYPEARQVHCGTDGTLYGVEPPDPGWEVPGSDTGTYATGAGIDIGDWVDFTGLTADVAQAVASGERFDVTAVVQAQNLSSNQNANGTIQIGFGIEGAEPTGSGQTFQIAPGYAGTLHVSITTKAVTLAPNDTIKLWARRTFGNHVSFNVEFDGSTTVHAMEISVPGGGGSGATELNGLTDVQITTPATGEVLAYTSASLMENQTLAEAGIQPHIPDPENGNLVAMDGAGIVADATIAATDVVRKTVTGNITTGYPSDIFVYAGATVEPKFSEGNAWLITAATVTLNEPTEFGSGILIVNPGVTLTIAAGYKQVGSDTGPGPNKRIATLVYDGVDYWLIWAGSPS